MARPVLGRGFSRSWIVRGNSAFLADYLSITTQPSGAVSGDALTTQPVIQLREGDGSAKSVADVTVTAAIATGTGSLSGTTTANTDASGVATFSNLAITGSGTHTLTFTATGYTAVTSGGFNVSDGSLYFESTWENGTGAGDTAITDGGKWTNGWTGAGSNEATPIMTVIGPTDPTGDAWTGTGNVMEVTVSASNDMVLYHDTIVPEATTHYGRMYIMWNSGSYNPFTNNHPFAYDYVGTIDWVFLRWTNRNGNPHPCVANGVEYWLGGSGAGAIGLTKGVWWRYEWKMEWVTGSTFKCWPRWYNDEGTLVYDSDDYIVEDGSTVLTDYWASNTQSPDGTAAEMRQIGWGNPSTDNGADGSQAYYVADFAISLTDWVGA